MLKQVSAPARCGCKRGQPIGVDLVVGGDAVRVMDHQHAGPRPRPFGMGHVAGNAVSSCVSMRATIVIGVLLLGGSRYSTATSAPPEHALRALRRSSRVLSTLALQIQTVAVGWQLYLLTGRARFDLGLVGLAQFVPTAVLTLVVGQVADRYDRRIVVVICHVVEGAAAAALALGNRRGAGSAARASRPSSWCWTPRGRSRIR